MYILCQFIYVWFRMKWYVLNSFLILTRPQSIEVSEVYSIFFLHSVIIKNQGLNSCHMYNVECNEIKELQWNYVRSSCQFFSSKHATHLFIKQRNQSFEFFQILVKMKFFMARFTTNDFISIITNLFSKNKAIILIQISIWSHACVWLRGSY